MKVIIQFIIKEFLQFKRDPKMFRVVLIAPVLQSILLGYAATLDINIIDVAIFNKDKSVTSRNYIDKFERSGYFKIRNYVDSYSEITDLIDKGKISSGIVIPEDFEKDLGTNRTTNIQLLLDGSDGNKASIAVGYIQAVTSEFSQNILLNMMEKRGLKRVTAGQLIPEVRIWYNPELKTRNFMVPSITSLILMLVTTLLTSLAVVKEKEIGTLEQLIVTPIKPFQMIIGKLVPFIILGFAAMLLVNSVMIFWFGIPVRGSYLFLLFASFIFILSTLGLGLFVSTISKTQQQAMMITTFAVMMPMIYLSGFAFPIENMPVIIQYVTYLIPLRYFITIIRGVVLKGLGFSNLWFELLTLFLMGVVIFIASALRFRKKLE